MRDVDQLASFFMMGMMSNINLKQRTKTSMVIEAFEYAEEFLRIAKKRDEEERKARSDQLKGKL